MDHDEQSINQKALQYHRKKPHGKLSVQATKPCTTQEDLSLAYSPGVAAPVLEIAENPIDAYNYTNKGNLVAVISNGTAILGLGNRGALASKPVMEGKAVLFKKFANIDVFDIEVDCTEIDEFVRTVKNIAPTFGGINLEDIAAPACFEIEKRLQEELDIPVFHDDQHGTAVIIAAGLINALNIQQKEISDIKIVCIGAGSAGIASMKLLLELGVKSEQIYMIDRQGVIHDERSDLNIYKQQFASPSNKRSLADAMNGADVVIGVSGPDIITQEMLLSMAEKPILFALSNPKPEINPKLIHQLRPDAILATGRSDYPNQVNNVLGFPYIFRGALDARAHSINASMLLAAVEALVNLTREPVPQNIRELYHQDLQFGKEYIIPTPFDPRLKDCVATAVARAAKQSNACLYA